jgi:hypothetical protein
VKPETVIAWHRKDFGSTGHGRAVRETVGLGFLTTSDI